MTRLTNIDNNSADVVWIIQGQTDTNKYMSIRSIL
jgi:hypothetical protein